MRALSELHRAPENPGDFQSRRTGRINQLVMIARAAGNRGLTIDIYGGKGH
jgi:hypothetical protein